VGFKSIRQICNSRAKRRNDGRHLNVCFKYFEAIKEFVYLTVTWKCRLSTIYAFVEKKKGLSRIVPQPIYK